MKIQDIMTVDVVTVRPEAPLKKVGELLAALRISGVPVVDRDRAVIGVVSQGDILFKERGPSQRTSALAQLLGLDESEDERKREARTAAEAMSAPVVTIRPERPVREAARLMLDERVHRLPVVDEEGELVGIVTRSDLVRAFARPDRAIAGEIREEVLPRELWLREPEAVTVAVDAGKVTLSGSVDTRSDAELVPAFVARIPGVVEVDSSLTWREDDRRRR